MIVKQQKNKGEGSFPYRVHACAQLKVMITLKSLGFLQLSTNIVWVHASFT